ncbi:MAG: GNAT family N-acetyltransferase [Oricola sp.]
MESGGVHLERVGPEARTLVEKLQADAYARTRAALGTQPMPLDWDYARILAECEVWVCSRDGAPAGALILRRGKRDLYLESIATVPGAAGTGLGRAMMVAAFDRARALGLPEIRLKTNALNPALAWYNQLGFAVEREEILADRTAVHMVAAVA